MNRIANVTSVTGLKFECQHGRLMIFIQQRGDPLEKAVYLELNSEDPALRDHFMDVVRVCEGPIGSLRMGEEK